MLLHGFPDNQHLYDRLVPELAGRRVVAFDFLGWGASDKPAGYAYTASNQTGDLDAVIEHLQLAEVVLVAHDASGPTGDRLGPRPPGADIGAGPAEHLLLPHAERLRPPEAIWLFSTPIVRRRRPSRVDVVRRAAVSPHVRVAGGAFLP